MKDRLEEFVSNNREAFDVHEPDPSLWLKINSRSTLQAGKSRRFNWLRYAAAVAVIFAGFSTGIYYLTGAKQQPGGQYSEVFIQLAESETYYNQLVHERYSELEPYLTSMPGIQKDLDTDLEELDRIYNELKSDLQKNVANPEVVEAMIQNYRIKVEILEDLLYQIKEKEYENNKEQKQVAL